MTRLPFGPDEKITDILKVSKFTLSAEVIPPRNGANQLDLLDEIAKLTSAGAQFLAVTKGAGGSLRGGSLPLSQLIKETFHTPCIAHFTCRDLTPEEVENQIMDHHYFGIRNILALRGDPPRGAPEWVAKEGSYNYAHQLIEQIRKLNSGEYLERKNFSVARREPTNFCIGAAAYPDHPDPKERLEFFRQKVDAGAHFGITQMLFSPESYSEFLEALSKAGISIPILPGSRMIRSKAQALKMAERFQVAVSKEFLGWLPETDQDATAEQTRDAFLKLTEKFRTAGAPGIHLFVLSDTPVASLALKALHHSSCLEAMASGRHYAESN